MLIKGIVVFGKDIKVGFGEWNLILMVKFLLVVVMIILLKFGIFRLVSVSKFYRNI